MIRNYIQTPLKSSLIENIYHESLLSSSSSSSSSSPSSSSSNSECDSDLLEYGNLADVILNIHPLAKIEEIRRFLIHLRNNLNAEADESRFNWIEMEGEIDKSTQRLASPSSTSITYKDESEEEEEKDSDTEITKWDDIRNEKISLYMFRNAVKYWVALIFVRFDRDQGGFISFASAMAMLASMGHKISLIDAISLSSENSINSSSSTSNNNNRRKDVVTNMYSSAKTKNLPDIKSTFLDILEGLLKIALMSIKNKSNNNNNSDNNNDSNRIRNDFRIGSPLQNRRISVSLNQLENFHQLVDVNRENIITGGSSNSNKGKLQRNSASPISKLNLISPREKSMILKEKETAKKQELLETLFNNNSGEYENHIHKEEEEEESFRKHRSNLTNKNRVKAMMNKLKSQIDKNNCEPLNFGKQRQSFIPQYQLDSTTECLEKIAGEIKENLTKFPESYENNENNNDNKKEENDEEILKATSKFKSNHAAMNNNLKVNEEDPNYLEYGKGYHNNININNHHHPNFKSSKKNGREIQLLAKNSNVNTDHNNNDQSEMTKKMIIQRNSTRSPLLEKRAKILKQITKKQKDTEREAEHVNDKQRIHMSHYSKHRKQESKKKHEMKAGNNDEDGDEVENDEHEKDDDDEYEEEDDEEEEEQNLKLGNKSNANIMKFEKKRSAILEFTKKEKRVRQKFQDLVGTKVIEEILADLRKQMYDSTGLTAKFSQKPIPSSSFSNVNFRVNHDIFHPEVEIEDGVVVPTPGPSSYSTKVRYEQIYHLGDDKKPLSSFITKAPRLVDPTTLSIPEVGPGSYSPRQLLFGSNLNLHEKETHGLTSGRSPSPPNSNRNAVISNKHTHLHHHLPIEATTEMRIISSTPTGTIFSENSGNERSNNINNSESQLLEKKKKKIAAMKKRKKEDMESMKRIPTTNSSIQTEMNEIDKFIASRKFNISMLDELTNSFYSSSSIVENNPAALTSRSDITGILNSNNNNNDKNIYSRPIATARILKPISPPKQEFRLWNNEKVSRKFVAEELMLKAESEVISNFKSILERSHNAHQFSSEIRLGDRQLRIKSPRNSKNVFYKHILMDFTKDS